MYYAEGLIDTGLSSGLFLVVYNIMSSAIMTLQTLPCFLPRSIKKPKFNIVTIWNKETLAL